MQHVNKLITPPSEKSGEQTRNVNAAPLMLTDKQMGQVWERMARMYGHRWTSNYGAQDDGTWRKGLAGITPEQIGVGLVKCLEHSHGSGVEDWPPTLSEFRAMCLPEKIPTYHRDYIALPRPPRDPELIKKSLAAMREVLG